MAYPTIGEIAEEYTRDVLDKLDPDNIPLPSDLQNKIVNDVQDRAWMENQLRPKEQKLTPPGNLMPKQIAMILLRLHNIVKIMPGGSGSKSKQYLLAIYQADGPDEGTYIADDEKIMLLASEYNYFITTRELNEVIRLLALHAPNAYRCMDRDMIAVNNGIFNYKTKELMPFSPEYVFLSKCRVDYNPVAVNVIIHNDKDNTDWDVESWIAELSDDPEVIELIWQLLGAIIRPLVRWKKMACLVSSLGNNGKGTLCTLMRKLCGEDSCASIPLADFGKDFALEQLVNKQAIIVDENDVGTFIDKAANLKAVVTNDVISINRKYEKQISYQFFGFMVQCLNESPRIRDKSDSLFRRLLIIPFEKCFTGMERSYIKEDYINRQEVLEYVLCRVLHTDFYELSVPSVCEQALDEYKEFNDPVRQFWADMEFEFTWDLVPFTFLYSLYKAWMYRNNPCGAALGRNAFIKEIRNVSKSSSFWYYTGKSVASKGRMDKPEPLIIEYSLNDWRNPTYVGSDPDRIATPKPKDNYIGLQRHNM